MTVFAFKLHQSFQNYLRLCFFRTKLQTVMQGFNSELGAKLQGITLSIVIERIFVYLIYRECIHI